MICTQYLCKPSQVLQVLLLLVSNSCYIVGIYEEIICRVINSFTHQLQLFQSEISENTVIKLEIELQ